MQNMLNAAPMPLTSPPRGVLLRILGGGVRSGVSDQKMYF